MSFVISKKEQVAVFRKTTPTKKLPNDEKCLIIGSAKIQPIASSVA